MTSAAPAMEVERLVDHLFRQEAGKMVSTLTKVFGIERLTLAEDVVQEALVRALQTWPYYGIPQNPSAWIARVSRNLALDVIRRESVFRHSESEIARWMAGDPAGRIDEDVAFGNEIQDDRLRMMFVCCHPLIPREAQASLALKILCGFGMAEIAKAFLTSEAAIAKRLTRAKQKIRDAGIPFEMPAARELAPRLDGVLQTLYLLFNEGYKASTGETLVREDLCREAIRLASFLVEHPVGNRPRTHALLALMLLSAARLRTRVDAQGNILRLKDQDRSRWDQTMIARGMFHLRESAAGEELSHYHLEAAIAGCHCAARDYDSTDWRQILVYYDRLIEMDDSPVVALNRAVAVTNVHGPRAGIEAVEAIQNLDQLGSYHLLYAILGEFEAELTNRLAAINYFRKARKLATMEPERKFLSKRIEEV